MAGVHRPSIDVRADDVASRLFLLDQRVMVRLADALGVFQTEEQFGVSLMRCLVVDHCSTWMVTIVEDKQATAATAGVEVTKQGLLPDTVWASPSLVLVELSVLLCFWSAEVRTGYAFCHCLLSPRNEVYVQLIIVVRTIILAKTA